MDSLSRAAAADMTASSALAADGSRPEALSCEVAASAARLCMAADVWRCGACGGCCLGCAAPAPLLLAAGAGAAASPPSSSSCWTTAGRSDESTKGLRGDGEAVRAASTAAGLAPGASADSAGLAERERLPRRGMPPVMLGFGVMERRCRGTESGLRSSSKPPPLCAATGTLSLRQQQSNTSEQSAHDYLTPCT